MQKEKSCEGKLGDITQRATHEKQGFLPLKNQLHSKMETKKFMQGENAPHPQ